MKKVLAITLVAAVLGLTGCGADPSSQPGADGTSNTSNKITGSVSEWRIDVSATKAMSGEVTFAIANFGTIQHEFLVTRTSYEPGQIPLGANNRFDEDLEGIDVIDEISEWPANEARVLTVNLSAGTYELLCNLPGHYANGMHRTLIVE